MAIYNGFIVQEPIYTNDQLVVLSSNNKIIDNNDFYEKVFRCATIEERKVLDNYFSKLHDEKKINDEEVSKIINKYYHIDSTYHKKIPVVFELYYDNDGNMYGRELVNNKLFPVLKHEKYEFTIDDDVISGIVEENGRMYFTKTTTSYHNQGREYFYDYLGNGGTFIIKSARYGINYKVNKQPIISHKLTLTPIFSHTNEACFNAPIILDKPASEYDIREYRTSKNFGRRSQILQASETNAYKVDPNTLIYPSSKGNKPTRSEVLNLLDEVELKLSKLCTLNSNLYNKYYEKYRNVITNNTNNNVVIDYLKELSDLINEIDEAIKYVYSNKEFVTYLDNLINDNIIDFKLGLNDINNLTNKFYDYVTIYPMNIVKEINNRIGILYFLYLTNNKSEINHLMDDNGYIKDNLKIIYVIMHNLYKNGYLDNFNELNEINSETLSRLIMKTNLKVNKEDNIKLI